jgi:hypothetical protein
MASGELAIPDFSDDIEFSDLIIEREIGQGAFGKVKFLNIFSKAPPSHSMHLVS